MGVREVERGLLDKVVAHGEVLDGATDGQEGGGGGGGVVLLLLRLLLQRWERGWGGAN